MPEIRMAVTLRMIPDPFVRPGADLGVVISKLCQSRPFNVNKHSRSCLAAPIYVWVTDTSEGYAQETHRCL